MKHKTNTLEQDQADKSRDCAWSTGFEYKLRSKQKQTI